MALTRVEQLKNAYELLSSENVKTVVLVGKSGVGKTWMARKLSERASREQLFDTTLWIFLKRKYDSRALHESIARQLSLISSSEEWEVDDEEEGNGESLQSRISAALKSKRLLLILDDEVNQINEVGAQLSFLKPAKTLVTTTNRDGIHKSEEDKKVIEVKPLSVDESLSLLQERAGETVYELPGIKPLAETFIKKNNCLPASIIMLAKALTYVGQYDSAVQRLESALREASDGQNFNIMQFLCTGYGSLPLSVLIDCCCHGSRFFCNRGSIHYNELIAYWMVEGYLGHIDSIEKAYQKGHHILMELIDCQILKKMEAGYVVMEELKMDFDDCQHCVFGGTGSLGLANVFVEGNWEGFGRITHMDGMIRTLRSAKGQKLSTLLLDGNCPWTVVLNNLSDYEQDFQVLVFFNPTLESLSLPFYKMQNCRLLVLRGCDFFSNIGLSDINLTTRLEKLTVLEISGPSSLMEISQNFFSYMPHLRSVNLSALQIDILPSSLYSLTSLLRLILRGCSRLEELRSLDNFKNLMLLDLSGATSLKQICDKTFRNQKLQMLSLSGTKIKKLPLLKMLRELTHLSLSNCTYLDRLPSIGEVTSLQVLDLSGARVFREFHEKSLERNADLKILDLSETLVDQLPSDINLRRLYLKGCSQLKELPFIKGLKDLEVLDLSGSSNLADISNEFFKHLSHLRILNLSRTKVKSLPSLSNLCNLRHLLLFGCLYLEKLPDLNSLKKLEMLDLSGCCALTEKLQNSSDQNDYHQHENSVDGIECQLSLSSLSNLCHLLLKNCTNLKVLPRLESLTKLEELNLRGISSLKDTGTDFLKYMSNLQVLDLSETMIDHLPSMSNLKNLKQLALSGCSGLETVPHLEFLTKLEILDLSGTAIRSLPCLDSFSNLRRLLLRDCSNLEEFRDLETLNLLRAQVKELPYGISKLIRLDHLDLPTLKITQGVDIGKIECLPEEPNQYHWNISSFPMETLMVNGGPHVSISSNQFLQLFKKNPSLWERYFMRFHFCVHPTEEQDKDGNGYFYRNELIFRDIYFHTSQFAHFKEQRSLEIRGFCHFPEGIDIILCHADCVFLIENIFVKCLSDVGASNLENVKGCWIERCSEMKHVFPADADKAEGLAKLGRTLEVLVISNAINLNSVYSGNLKCDIYRNLKRLHLDCCPELSTVFSSSQLPANLRDLQIKFCDKLEYVVHHTSSEHPSLNLEMLQLWELPKLKKIGCTLPSLQTVKVGECPELQELEENIKLTKSLQVLFISSVTDLKNIYSGNLEPEAYEKLKSLTVENCPMLVNIFSSPHPPVNLETLQIKHCHNLQIVFEHSSSVEYTLLKLHTLHLQKLPKLGSIGGTLPFLQNPVIMECPNCKLPVT